MDTDTKNAIVSKLTSEFTTIKCVDCDWIVYRDWIAFDIHPDTLSQNIRTILHYCYVLNLEYKLSPYGSVETSLRLWVRPVTNK